MAFLRPLALSLALAGAGALAYACSSKGTTNPPPPNTYTISKLSGDSQVGSAGALLSANLAVAVVDQNNSPAAGQTITWTATTGGGSVTGGTSQTDASGHATIGRTLGAGAGFQSTTASLSGATGSPITFTSISQIQGAFFLAPAGGSGQVDTVLATLTNPFQVSVTDHLGAPVAGVVVTFSVFLGGGSLTQVHDTSDGSGHATAKLMLPATAGAQNVHASVTGLVGSPVGFGATANAGNPTQLVKSTGDSQGGLISVNLAAPHLVLVQDAHGNGVSGVTIQWAAGVGGGLVSNTGPTSDGTGTVSITRTLGPSLGVQTDTAKATLSGSPIVFTSFGDSVTHAAAVTVGPGIVFTPNSSKVGSVGTGGTVTWNWAGGPHSVEWKTGPVVLTSSSVMSSGTYSVTFTTPGTYTYDCAVHGAAMSGTVVVRP